MYGRIAPRSGLAWKWGLGVGTGVIDSDYRGEIKVLLFNHSQSMVVIKTGDRIAQLIFEYIYEQNIEEIKKEKVTITERQTQGFGSTGLELQAKEKRKNTFHNNKMAITMGRWWMVLLLIWLCIPDVRGVQARNNTGSCLQALEKSLFNKKDETTSTQTIIQKNQGLTITVASEAECLHIYILIGMAVFGHFWWFSRKLTVLYLRINNKGKSRLKIGYYYGWNGWAVKD